MENVITFHFLVFYVLISTRQKYRTLRKGGYSRGSTVLIDWLL